MDRGWFLFKDYSRLEFDGLTYKLYVKRFGMVENI